MHKPRLLFLVTEDWYFCSHRLPLGIAAVREGYDVVVATRVGLHAERIKAAGIRVRPLNITRGGHSPAGELRVVLEIARIYREERPDMVHHVALKPVLYGSLVSKFVPVRARVNAIAGLGFIYTSNAPKARFLRPLVSLLLRVLLPSRKSHLILQNSDDVALLREQVGIDSSSISLIAGSGVDLDVFTPHPEPEGPLVVVLPARMLRDKGVYEFVSAARRLRGEGLDARFALVGGVDKENPGGVPESVLRQWQEEKAVEWWGHQDDMSRVFQQANLVCLPSYREGLPKALIEAAACGRAIVTTDTPGCRDVVRHGQNGLLVPPRDEERLATALRSLLSDASTRRQMGAQGRAIATTQFSLERVVAQTLEVYRHLLDE